MPSKLVLPSMSVFSSTPPRLCFPPALTGCMITAALRTGLPLSSLITTKLRTAVGSSVLSRCATTPLTRARTKAKQTKTRRVIFPLASPISDVFITAYSSEWSVYGEGPLVKNWNRAALRFHGGADFALEAQGLRSQVDQVARDPRGVMAGNSRLFEVVP